MRIHQFIAAAPRGRVRISHEHTGHRWMEPGLYAERYLHESRAISTPRFAPWIREMRHVTGLVQAWMAGPGVASGPHAAPFAPDPSPATLQP